jgi:hypothetical protein
VKARRRLRPHRPAPQARRVSRDAWLALAVCGPALAVAVLAPTPVAITAALVAGATLERYRQGRRERPLRLADTPAAWADDVRESVGVRPALVAGLAALAALGVLTLPSLAVDGDSDGRSGQETSGPSHAKPTLPRIAYLRRAPHRAFKASGVRFRVFRIGRSVGGVQIQRMPASGHSRWVSVGVDIRNIARRRFRPSDIAYRLKDGRGRSYWPEIGGGTGPSSLGRTGYVGRGEIAQTRLSFRVPRSAHRLSLIFEPGSKGAVQVHVPLG